MRGTTILSTNRLFAIGLVALILAALVAAGGLTRLAIATHPGTTVLVDAADGTGDGVSPYTCGAAANPCDTIQHGVDHASAGDTVEVAVGTYAESVTIDKSVTLVGVGGQPQIDASGLPSAVTITSSAVTLDNFDITGDGSTRVGVAVFGSGSDITGTSIVNNSIHDIAGSFPAAFYSFGILVNGNLDDISGLVINNNEIDSIGNIGSGVSGAGISLEKLSGASLDGNTISNIVGFFGISGAGIFLEEPLATYTVSNNSIDTADIGIINYSTNGPTAITRGTGAFTNVPVYVVDVPGGTSVDVNVQHAMLTGLDPALGALLGLGGPASSVVEVYTPLIQTAIDLASPAGGSTIDVSAGTYTATAGALAVIDRPILLNGSGESGPSATILDGGTYGAGQDTSGIGTSWPRAIVVRSSDVTIQNLKVTNFQGNQVTTGGYGIVARGENSWTGSGDTTFTGLVFQDVTLEDAYYGLRVSLTNGVIAQRLTYQVAAGVPNYGIYATLSPAALIQDNVLNQGSLWLAQGSDNGQVLNNTITDAPWNGIWAGIGFSVNSNSPTITGNSIDGCGEGGIVLWNNASPAVTDATISDNTVTGCEGGSDDHGGISIYAGEYTNLVISGNDSSANGGDQPGLTFTTAKLTLASITENTLSNNLGAGIRLSSVTRGDVAINGNAISGNATGLTMTGGTASVLDSSANWWGTSTATGVAAEVSANVDYSPWLASATDTSGDPGFQGDFSVLHVDDDSPQSDATGHIQEGVDLVSGSTVNVEAGTYIEQVEIDKAVTLTGAGEGSTFIQGFDSMPLFFVTGSNNNHPVVYVHDTTGVVIEDLTVDGDGKGNTNYRYEGIGINNAGATIQDVTVIDVQDTPFSGSQHGTGIYALNDDATDRTVTVDNATVYDFQKAGIVINGANAIGQVQYSTVTGIGPTAVTAQNGIQLGFGARGQILDNTVSGMVYQTDRWAATGILGAGSGAISIDWNDVTASSGGIRVDNYSGVTTGVAISDNTVDGNTFNTVWGADTVTIERNSFDAGGEGLWIIDSTNVAGSDNSFSGNDYGLIIDGAVDGVAMSNSDFTDNVAIGIVVQPFYADHPINISITTSNIVGNGAGLDNTSVNEVLAERNWWGHATGADHAINNPHGTGQGGDTSSDNVDFTPWYATSTTNLSTENVTTTHNPVIALSDTIQGGIDAALDGDTVDVSAGTYTENVSVNKDVTLAGLNPPDGGSAAVVGGTVDLTANGATVQSLKVVPGSVTGNERAIAVYAGNTTVAGNLIEGMIGDGTGAVIGVGIYGGSKPALLNISVTDNVIRDIDNPGVPFSGADGISVQGVVDGVAITGNTIVDIHSAGWAYGIEITTTAADPANPPQNVQVLHNSISLVNEGSVYDVMSDPFAAPYPGIGLVIDETFPGADDGDASQVTVTYNDFVDLIVGAANKDTDQILNAENNWWDACDGPSGIGPGSGVIVGPGVDYDPWEAGKCDKDNDLLSDDEEIFVYGTDPNNPDTDGDGCIDGLEVLPKNLANSGGGRDPLNAWDYYDVAVSGGAPGQDGIIDLFNDIAGVIDHYGPTGTEPAYDVNFDRGPSVGPNEWNMTAPDGRIDLFNDISGVIAQFAHNCA